MIAHDVTPRKPSSTLAWLEPFRAMLELSALPAASPLLMSAPRGDGHPVLVLPGFCTGDSSTLILRQYLNYLGYRSEAWELGYNLGHETLGGDGSKLLSRLSKVVDRSGRRASIVGWSLGGVMARNVARKHPELVRQVITLGAPFAGEPTATSLRAFYEAVTGETLDSAAAMARFRRDMEPPPVPTTSIYTRSDGITAWQNCLEEETGTAENIEIAGSHSGLTHNPAALLLIAQRLAQPEGAWKRINMLD